MPFFHHKSDEEKQHHQEIGQQRAREQEEQQASVAALQAGGIPLQAQQRLDQLRRAGSAFFTSDLSVDEFLLARHAGFRPISQVMGSSIYHVGWQRMPGRSSYFSRSQELEVVSGAMNHARALALGRLAEEARRVGADAVIGVHVKRGEYDWGRDLIEFNTVGTAVSVQGGGPSAHPALTNLSGQDFWKLYHAGYRPLGVVASSTVYYVVAGWQNRSASSYWGRWYNQELQDFTQGLYTARHLAMSQVWQQAHQLGASGVVGMNIEQREEEYEVNLGNDQERTDMIFTFHAIGTAIAEPSDARAPSVYAAVKLDT